MKFVFLYRGGNAPQEQQQQYMQAWGTWIGGLAQKGIQKSGLPFAGGKVVSQDVIDTYQPFPDDVNGYSEIETATLDEAIEIAKGCPNMKYGGKVEVREAMNMPGM